MREACAFYNKCPEILYMSLSAHSFSNFDKATDVSALHVVNLVAILAVFYASIVDISSAVQLYLMEFWLISKPETATPPALAALPGAKRI